MIGRFQRLSERLGLTSIRTRLLLPLLLLSAAVVFDFGALVYLARSISASQERVDRARTRQELAGKMNQELSNAEAALYRYDLEGATGFADQFNFELAGFGNNVKAYRSLASTEDEKVWANELDQIDQDLQTLGTSLVRLHDRRSANLQIFLATYTQLSGLLGPLMSPTPGSSADYQSTAGRLSDDAQALLISVTANLATPDASDRAQFTRAQQRLERDLSAFDGLSPATAAPNDKKQIDTLVRSLPDLGATLMSDRDEQQLAYVSFSAAVFEGEQEVLVGQIQPLEEQRLEQAQSELQAATYSAIVSSLAVPLGLTLLAAAAAIRLARKLDRSILMLLRGADRVAAGDLSLPVRVGTTDELKRLAQAFNAMMTDLAAREQGARARLAQLEILRAVSLELTSTLDLDQVLQTIANSASNLVGAATVEIFTRGENGGPVRLVADAGRPAATPADWTAQDWIAAVAETKKSRVVHAPTENHAHTSVAFPLRLGDQVLGVLRISSAVSRTLTSEDLRILDLLADQASVALGNARLYHDLADREERVRMLMEKMAQVQDEERRLVGLDLHDGLTQLVISANMHLNALSSTLAATTDPRARQELEETRTLVRRAIEEARRVIAELRPTVVEDFGLAGGLRRYVQDVSEAERWECETQIELDGMKLSAPAEAAIFRIAQEALSNARKHSDTHLIQVVLRREGDELLLNVQDWGRGFDPAAVDDAGQIGLMGMKERAAMLDGKCDIASAPGQGTAVTVRVPLARLGGSAHEQRE